MTLREYVDVLAMACQMHKRPVDPSEYATFTREQKEALVEILMRNPAIKKAHEK